MKCCQKAEQFIIIWHNRASVPRCASLPE